MRAKRRCHSGHAEPATNSNPAGHQAARQAPRWPRGLPAHVAVAVAALALRAWTLRYPDAFQHAATAGPSYAEEQRAEAKQRVCAAFDTARTGITANTNLANPDGPTDTLGSMWWRRTHEWRCSQAVGTCTLGWPATPDDLATNVRRFADPLMDLAPWPPRASRTPIPRRARGCATPPP